MIWNFCAGPAMLPHEVLVQAQAELLDWNGMGVSVMEVSHRSPEFEALAAEAKKDLCDLLNLPDSFEILFTAGGAQAQFALAPMNLLEPHEVANYLITGGWSARATDEATRFAQVYLVADGKASNYTQIPPRESWQLNPQAKYFHYVSNETIHGVQFKYEPEVDEPLVVDMSSDFLSKPIDFTRMALIYAGAQKNVGPAGMTIVIIHREYLERCTTRTPHVFNYATLARHHSLANTPPIFSWYLSSLVFKWLKKQGGLAAIAKRNAAKADLLYETIDQSSLYTNAVNLDCRSTMNVIFDLREPTLLPKFLADARAHGLLALKGHKTRGGVRASIYNAMPIEGVQALVDFMKEFEKSI